MRVTGKTNKKVKQINVENKIRYKADGKIESKIIKIVAVRTITRRLRQGS